MAREFMKIYAAKIFGKFVSMFFGKLCWNDGVVNVCRRLCTKKGMFEFTEIYHKYRRQYICLIVPVMQVFIIGDGNDPAL
jgi:hypothetical protein